MPITPKPRSRPLARGEQPIQLRRLRGRGFRAFALGFGLLGLLALAGCGDDDDGIQIERPEGDSVVYGSSGWTTEKDPVTGIEYRCLTIVRGFGGGYAGGLGVECFPK